MFTSKRNDKVHFFLNFYWILVCGCFILISCQPKAILEPNYITLKKEQGEKASEAWLNSYATIDCSINLSPYFKQLNETVPSTFHQANWMCEGLSYDLNAERSPIVFTGKNQKLNYTTNLKYDLQLNYCPKCSFLLDEKGICITPRIKGSCGLSESKRNAIMGFTTQIDILPNFSLSSTTQLTELNLVDPCEITIAYIDITSELKKELSTQLEQVSTDIDSKIESIKLNGILEKAWEEICKPIAIPSYGQLHLSPQSLLAPDFSFKENKLNLPLELHLKPTFETSSPKIIVNKKPSFTATSPKKGFDVTVQLNLGYDSLSSYLYKAIAKEKIAIKGKTLLLDSIKTHPDTTQRMNLDVYFSGDFSGILHLTGTPCIDDQKQVLFFPDLKYKLRFKNFLFTALSNCYSKSIYRNLKSSLSFEISPLLADLKKEIENGLNQKVSNDLKLLGKVEQLKLLHIDVTQPTFTAYMRINGSIKLLK